MVFLTSRGRRGGSVGAGTGPAIHASGSFQISALLCLLVYVMAQTGAIGAAAIELLVSFPISTASFAPISAKFYVQWEISVSKRRLTLM